MEDTAWPAEMPVALPTVPVGDVVAGAAREVLAMKPPAVSWVLCLALAAGAGGEGVGNDPKEKRAALKKNLEEWNEPIG